VAPENLHLTLRFIGEVDGRDAEDIDAALSGIRFGRFSLTLAGVGEFGDERRLRSLWVGVEPNGMLERLQAKVEQAVQRAGQPPEKRKFKPHVTLARFKTHPGGRLEDYFAMRSLFRAPPFEVRALTLFSSYLSHEGAIYSPEAVYPLD
jgi:2'-5' RNA ligase